MLGAALFAVAIAFAPPPLPPDVHLVPTRRIVLPVRSDRDGAVRVFVSGDQGSKWTHVTDVRPGDNQVVFTAPRDGLYWFGSQVIRQGDAKRAAPSDLDAATKVYVYTGLNAPKPNVTREVLEREVEVLRRTVERLEMRVKELEKEREQK